MIEIADERMCDFHINDFPNEILGMIFDRLPFRDLRGASRVCARWRAVVTSLCSHRILLRVRATKVEQLNGFHNHKHIAVDFNNKLLKVNGDHVMRWMDWLKDVAPTLETLVINISVRLFPSLVELDFKNLKELHLEFSDSCRIKDSQQLNQFFRGLKRLKIVKIEAHRVTFTQLTRCIYSLNNIERLELSPNRSFRLQTDGFWNMTGLVELNITGCGLFECPPEDTISPLPSLRKLKLDKIKPQELSKLQILFRNVTNLKICMPISGVCLHRIVTIWPTLEHLSVTVSGLYRIETDLRRLSELRWIKLRLVVLQRYCQRSSYRVLDSLLCNQSLERLYLTGKGEFSIPDRNPRCQLFLNGQFMPR
uniref:F-box domain-containing protein n=1 Tax=Culex tarsalis TaxID=7177 RepID=A0A1Q3EWB3_CULTA